MIVDQAIIDYSYSPYHHLGSPPSYTCLQNAFTPTSRLRFLQNIATITVYQVCKKNTLCANLGPIYGHKYVAMSDARTPGKRCQAGYSSIKRNTKGKPPIISNHLASQAHIAAIKQLKLLNIEVKQSPTLPNFDREHKACSKMCCSNAPKKPAVLNPPYRNSVPAT